MAVETDFYVGDATTNNPMEAFGSHRPTIAEYADWVQRCTELRPPVVTPADRAHIIRLLS